MPFIRGKRCVCVAIFGKFNEDISVAVNTVNGMQLIMFLCFLHPKIHAIVLTPGLMERCDVCNVRAAETSHGSCKSQLLNFNVTSNVYSMAATATCKLLFLFFVVLQCIYSIQM